MPTEDGLREGSAIAQRTPGPWHSAGWDVQAVDNRGIRKIARVYHFGSGLARTSHTKVDEANLDLVKAAPDLLDALQELRRAYKDLSEASGWPMDQNALDDADAAISKAIPTREGV